MAYLWLYVFGVVVFLFILLLWAIAPAKVTKAQKAPFVGRTFAHKGLHLEDESVPENSLRAFELAVEAGYGIELDIQLSSDNQVVVIHDDNLERSTGVNRRVDELSYEELEKLQLSNTGEKIPLFTAVLSCVHGQVPLIVELKTGRQNDQLCAAALKILQSYEGVYCVESFDPRIVGWFRRHAPQILRGQISNPGKYFEHIPKLIAFGMGHLLFDFFSRPQFIAYDTSPQSWVVKLARKMSGMTVAWTVQPEHDLAYFMKHNDSVIFEYIRPDTHYNRKN